MDKENVVYVCTGVLFSHKEELNYVVCRKTSAAGGYYIIKDNRITKDKCLLPYLIYDPEAYKCMYNTHTHIHTHMT